MLLFSKSEQHGFAYRNTLYWIPVLLWDVENEGLTVVTNINPRFVAQSVLRTKRAQVGSVREKTRHPGRGLNRLDTDSPLSLPI